MGTVAGGLTAFCFVLALIFLGTRALRGVAGRGRLGARRGRLEVIERIGLAPRQGLALVRVGTREALVSYGDGGVRLVAQLEDDGDGSLGAWVASGQEPADASVLSASGDRQRSPMVRPPMDRGLWQRVRAAVRAGAVAVVLLAGNPLAWQAAGGTAMAAAQEPPAQEAVAEPVGTGAGENAGRAPLAPPLEVLSQSFPEFDLSRDEDGSLRLKGPVGAVVFIGFLTLLPTLLLLMTSFTRILVVLQLLKQAIGTQTAPPGHLLIAMALLLTGFVMAPTFDRVNESALVPWVAGEIDEGQMLAAAVVPFREFMLERTREQDLETFVGMQAGDLPETVEDVTLPVLATAFVTSELRRAFQMGFALFLPFVVIDVVVASVLMSMGMFMLPPVMVSLPFKLLLFVLVDGWALIIGSLVQSFN